MRALLEKARSGDEAALLEAGSQMAALSRDGENVFLPGEGVADLYQEGALLYAVYMEYETKHNKKAGYADIAAQLGVLAARLENSYELSAAAGYVKLLADTLSVTSPEIYEHYRTIQELLKSVVRLIVKREELVLEYFPKRCLKTDVSGKDAEALRSIGQSLLAACGRDQLSQERYGELGEVLADLL